MKLFRCPHGCFHLTIESTTVHLSKKQVRDLGTLMKQVMTRYGEVLNDGASPGRLDRWPLSDGEHN